MTFSVFKNLEEPFCDPIYHFLKMAEEAVLVGCGMTTGFLFRDHHHLKGLSTDRMIPQKVTERLKGYLTEMGDFEGETLYSFRSAAAIEEAFKGTSVEGVMNKIGWGTKESADRYMRLKQILQAADISHKSMAEVRTIYEQLNKGTGLSPVF
jgi:hypothetical protein